MHLKQLTDPQRTREYDIYYENFELTDNNFSIAAFTSPPVVIIARSTIAVSRFGNISCNVLRALVNLVEGTLTVFSWTPSWSIRESGNFFPGVLSSKDLTLHFLDIRR